MTMGSLEGQRGRAFQRGVSFGVGGEGHGGANHSQTTNHATEEGRASEKLGRGGGGDEEAAEVAWREEELESKQVQTVAQAQEQSRTIERLVGVFVLEGGAVDAHAARACE